MGMFAKAGPLIATERCFGFPLAPLRLGDVLLLQQLNSPLVTGGDMELGDVLLALCVINSSHKSAARWLGSKWLRKTLIWVVGRLAGCYDMRHELSAFVLWWKEQWASPAVKPAAEGSTMRLRSPESWRLAAALTYCAGYSWGDITAIPLQRARALWLAYAEMRGWVQLEDDLDIDEAWAQRNRAKHG